MAIFDRSFLGPSTQVGVVAGGTTSTNTSLSAIGNALSHRFVARDTRNVAYVWINFAGVTTANAIDVRIETDNGSGKPSGTLYDANATVTITPSAGGTNGWQQCTFATTPTTGLVKDSIYHVVVIATSAGTTVNCRGYWTFSSGMYPHNTLTATDGTTRTNFAENSNAVGIFILGLTDGTTTTPICPGVPFGNSGNFSIYGNRAFSQKYVVPSGSTMSVFGVAVQGALRSGTPDDLRLSIYDGSNTLVTNAQVQLKKEALTGATGKKILFNFTSGITLSAGTYRVVLEQRNGASASTTTNSNTWAFYNASYQASAKPSGYIVSTTTDISAGVGSATWTDSTTDVAAIDLLVDTFGGSGGGGTYTAASNVRLGTDRGDGTIGTLNVPVSGNVLLGVAVDSVSGTLVLPANTTVLGSTIYGVNGTSLTGNLTVPAASNVLTAIQFGAGGNQYTGTITLPASGSVVSGVTYGAGGNQYTGSYSASGGGTYTTASNVRLGTDRGDGVLGTLAVPAASFVYTGISIDASVGTLTVPTAGQVTSGIVYGIAGVSLTGTVTSTIIGASNVRYGTNRGDGVTGTLVVPSPSNVLTGVSTDNTTGTLTIPLAAQTLTGSVFGVAGTSVTGTVVLPGANDVRSAVPYGVGGNGLTGRILLPGVTNVRLGIAYDRDNISTGTVVLPSVSNVAGGITYGAGGTEYTGTYSGSGGLTYNQLTTALDTRGLTVLPTGSLYPKVNIGQVNGVSASTYDGTAQGGSSITITLQTGSATGNIYLHRSITLVAGTGVGQSRAIIACTGLVMQVDSDWIINPDSTTKYVIGDTTHSWIIGAASGISFGSYGTPWGVIYTDGSSPMFGGGQKWTPSPNDPFPPA